MLDKTVRSTLWGIMASALLLGVYFATLTLISGWDFAQNQFASFWYFIVSLSAGFGIQIGLYAYLRGLIKGMHSSGPVKSPDGDHGASKALGVTGTTSTVAMISCCAHYLANILPIIGVAGVVTFIAQYQTELFWLGIFFNFAGIIYIARKISKIRA